MPDGRKNATIAELNTETNAGQDLLLKSRLQEGTQGK